MRKLGKKFSANNETIEAYACTCWCTCTCSSEDTKYTTGSQNNSSWYNRVSSGW